MYNICIRIIIIILLHHIKPVMAIAIKSIPVLKNKAAVHFTNKVTENSARRNTIDFSQQTTIASKILAKAKL